MASVTGQCPSQPEMHENRAEYVTGRLYLVHGVGRRTTAESYVRDPRRHRRALSRRSHPGQRPEPRTLPPFAGFLKRAALVTVAEVGVSTARVSRWSPPCCPPLAEQSPLEGVTRKHRGPVILGLARDQGATGPAAKACPRYARAAAPRRWCFRRAHEALDTLRWPPADRRPGDGSAASITRATSTERSHGQTADGQTGRRKRWRQQPALGGARSRASLGMPARESSRARATLRFGGGGRTRRSTSTLASPTSASACHPRERFWCQAEMPRRNGERVE
jgi:hypothetical protein